MNKEKLRIKIMISFVSIQYGNTGKIFVVLAQYFGGRAGLLVLTEYFWGRAGLLVLAQYFGGRAGSLSPYFNLT